MRYDSSQSRMGGGETYPGGMGKVVLPILGMPQDPMYHLAVLLMDNAPTHNTSAGFPGIRSAICADGHFASPPDARDAADRRSWARLIKAFSSTLVEQEPSNRWVR
jgi:hypothetical protein